MAFRVKQLDHVVLYVTNLDRAIRFYRDVLGCTVEHRGEVPLVRADAGRASPVFLDDTRVAKKVMQETPMMPTFDSADDVGRTYEATMF